MALAELVQKLRSKKQAATKTAFSHYLQDVVKLLASGEEVDADEVGHILEAVGRTESDLERDVSLQQQRLSWAAQLQANRQATADRILAENDLRAAQSELQKAYDRLTPAIQAAESRMRTLEQITLTTYQAESRLSELILDQELLQREQSVAATLRSVCDELRPLLADQTHLQHRIAGAEFQVERLRGRGHNEWYSLTGITNAFHKDERIKKAESHLADLRSQAKQLNAAIEPRQAEQRRLQSELDSIHAEKLKP